MPRVKTATPPAPGMQPSEIAWMQCLDCGLSVVSGIGPASRVCVGYEGEGCRSRRVVREVTARRYFRRQRLRSAEPSASNSEASEEASRA